MWVLCCDIIVGKFRFDKVKQVEIIRSTGTVGDTARIDLPLSSVVKGNTKLTLKNEIKRGDYVTIKLGYDNTLNLEFTGYVKSVQASEFLSIECEDNIKLLRVDIPNISIAGASLTNILDHIKANTGVDYVTDTKIDWTEYVIHNATAIEVIQKLKSDYGLSAFFNESGKLWIGGMYDYKSGNIEYRLKNDNKEMLVKANNLKYREASEKQFRVKAISMQANNKKLEVEFGDKSGDLRTFYAPLVITDKTQLENFAKNELAKYKYTGYEGSITTFLWPNAKPGMTAQITDIDGIKGKYYVPTVKTSFGDTGAQRTVEISIKLS
jgi:hypothetical protein